MHMRGKTGVRVYGREREKEEYKYMYSLYMIVLHFFHLLSLFHPPLARVSRFFHLHSLLQQSVHDAGSPGGRYLVGGDLAALQQRFGQISERLGVHLHPLKDDAV